MGFSITSRKKFEWVKYIEKWEWLQCNSKQDCVKENLWLFFKIRLKMVQELLNKVRWQSSSMDASFTALWLSPVWLEVLMDSTETDNQTHKPFSSLKFLNCNFMQNKIQHFYTLLPFPFLRRQKIPKDSLIKASKSLQSLTRLFSGQKWKQKIW